MRISRLVVGAALAAAPALLHAQMQPESARPIGLGVSGGVSLPVGNFSDFADVGFTVAGHVYVKPPSLKALSFRGDVSYDRWNFKDFGGVATDGNTSVLGVTANAILKLNSINVLHPYLLGGGGLASGKSSATVAGVNTDSERDNNFALQGGVGLDFALSGFATFLEAKFMNVFTGDNGSSSNSSARYIPITFGIRF